MTIPKKVLRAQLVLAADEGVLAALADEDHGFRQLASQELGCRLYERSLNPPPTLPGRSAAFLAHALLRLCAASSPAGKTLHRVLHETRKSGRLQDAHVRAILEALRLVAPPLKEGTEALEKRRKKAREEVGANQPRLFQPDPTNEPEGGGDFVSDLF